MSRYITFCGRCSLPCGTGKGLCSKCAKIMSARKKSIKQRENKKEKLREEK